MNAEIDISTNVGEDRSPRPDKVLLYSMTYDPRKIIAPSVFPPVPPDFFPGIGMIATAWGSIENSLDDLIRALVRGNSTEEPGWEGRGFKWRKGFALKEIRRAFPSKLTIYAYYSAKLNLASDVMWKRNLLVHGRHFGTGDRQEDGSYKLSITVIGRMKGNEVQCKFTKDDLDDLFYTLAHIDGLISAPTLLNAHLQELSSEDKFELQEFLRKFHPNLPNSGTPQPRPRP